LFRVKEKTWEINKISVLPLLSNIARNDSQNLTNATKGSEWGMQRENLLKERRLLDPDTIKYLLV
jgi:hypothetical protein